MFSHMIGHLGRHKYRRISLLPLLFLSSVCDQAIPFLLVPVRYQPSELVQRRHVRALSVVGVGSSSSSREELERLKVPELKEQLRALGLTVGGRKSELIDRIILGDNDANYIDVPSITNPTARTEYYDTAATTADIAYDSLPDDAIVIFACKSWGLFQRSALALQTKLQNADPSILVFGHPRGKGKSAWNPIDLKLVPGEPKSSIKGTFQVQRGGEIIVSIGPEQRPFEELRAADMEDIARLALAALKK